MEQLGAEAFYDSIADKYGWFFSSRPRTADILAEQIVALLKPYHVCSILDCSCGDGMQAIALAQRGFDVTAGDLSSGMGEGLRTGSKCGNRYPQGGLPKIGGCFQPAV